MKAVKSLLTAVLLLNIISLPAFADTASTTVHADDLQLIPSQELEAQATITTSDVTEGHEHSAQTYLKQNIADIPRFLYNVDYSIEDVSVTLYVTYRF